MKFIAILSLSSQSSSCKCKYSVKILVHVLVAPLASQLPTYGLGMQQDQVLVPLYLRGRPGRAPVSGLQLSPALTICRVS